MFRPRGVRLSVQLYRLVYGRAKEQNCHIRVTKRARMRIRQKSKIKITAGFLSDFTFQREGTKVTVISVMALAKLTHFSRHIALMTRSNIA